jgi:hypothetical protein
VRLRDADQARKIIQHDEAEHQHATRQRAEHHHPEN